MLNYGSRVSSTQVHPNTQHGQLVRGFDKVALAVLLVLLDSCVGNSNANLVQCRGSTRGWRPAIGKRPRSAGQTFSTEDVRMPGQTPNLGRHVFSFEEINHLFTVRTISERCETRQGPQHAPGLLLEPDNERRASGQSGQYPRTPSVSGWPTERRFLASSRD